MQPLTGCKVLLVLLIMVRILSVKTGCLERPHSRLLLIGQEVGYLPTIFLARVNTTEFFIQQGA